MKDAKETRVLRAITEGHVDRDQVPAEEREVGAQRGNRGAEGLPRSAQVPGHSVLHRLPRTSAMSSLTSPTIPLLALWGSDGLTPWSLLDLAHLHAHRPKGPRGPQIARHGRAGRGHPPPRAPAQAGRHHRGSSPDKRQATPPRSSCSQGADRSRRHRRAGWEDRPRPPAPRLSAPLGHAGKTPPLRAQLSEDPEPTPLPP